MASPHRAHSKKLHAPTAVEMITLMEEENSASYLRRLACKTIMAPPFDYGMAMIILFNLVIMIIETDRSVHEDEEDSSSTLNWTEVCGWIALLVFVLELSLRLFVFRYWFWRDAWNVFDFLVVAIDLFFSVSGIFFSSLFPVSILRIFRLAKLARVSKVLRIFPELRLLMAGLLGSISTIFWGTVLLIFVLLVWSMMAVLLIHPLAKNCVFDGCERCPHAYSSVMSAALTFWQQLVAGDSWGAATMPVIEMHPSTSIFFLLVFLTVGMAVMNLILGVVVSVAMDAKERGQAEDEKERNLQKMETQNHLLALCKLLDDEDSGEVSRDQVYAGFRENGEFRDNMLALDVSEEDLDIIWAIIDHDKKGSVPYKDLVSQLYSLRSSDTQFMLASIKYHINTIKNALLTNMTEQHEQVMTMENKVEQGIVMLEQEVSSEIYKLEEQVSELEDQLSFTSQASLGSSAPRQHSGESVGIWESINTNTGCMKELEIANIKTATGSPAADQVISSVDLNDQAGIWLKEFCLDVAKVHASLNQVLTDMNGRLGSELSLPVPRGLAALFMATPGANSRGTSRESSPETRRRRAALRNRPWLEAARTGGFGFTPPGGTTGAGAHITL